MDIKEIIKGVATSAEGVIRPEEGDYVVDGILYCHRCNTPKQTRITLQGKEMTPYCLCKCAKEKLDAEEEKRRTDAFLTRCEDLRKMAFPDAQMRDWTFDADDGTNEISKIARNYVGHFEQMKREGKGLLLYGGVGCGKSFISGCICNALIEKGIPCYMTNLTRIINTIGGMYDGKQDYIDGLQRFDLLVIDDLATERETSFAQEIVYNVIDSRIQSGLPMIVTTNLSAGEVKHPTTQMEQRIYSRILGATIPVAVKGDDRRKIKLKESVDKLKDMLMEGGN